MALRHIVISLLSAALSACASQSATGPHLPIANEAQAINLASKACYASEAKQPYPDATWHARLEADHWHVWAEDQTASDPVFVSVDLPANGEPVRACEACVWRMGWTIQEGPNHLALGCAREASPPT